MRYAATARVLLGSVSSVNPLLGLPLSVCVLPARKPHIANTKSSGCVVAAVVPLLQVLVEVVVFEAFWSTPFSGVVSTA
jgi:hypothetical protein